MLTHIHISNLAIIDHLDTSFDNGLTVLTGETGAGKSMILGAVGLLMGNRASTDSVRSGYDEAIVEGHFIVDPKNAINSILFENEVPFDGELILRRVISVSGRSRCYINNRLVNLSVLSEIGSRLLSVSGQHESQRLLKESEHLYLLDSFGGLDFLRQEVKTTYEKLTEIRAGLKALKRKKADRDDKVELLTFQLDELKKTNLQPRELEELELEVARLRNAADLSNGANSIHNALYGDEGSVSEILGTARYELTRLRQMDETLSPLLENLEGIGYSLDDLARELMSYADSVVSDPVRLNEAEERLDLIRRIIRKYAPNGKTEDVLKKVSGMSDELYELQNADHRLDELENEEREADDKLNQLADTLTIEREKAANRMNEAVEKELSDLCLDGSKFEVYFAEPISEPGPDGKDAVVFKFSANPGEPARPLARIASGGELSRVTLALKSILAGKDEIETVIFDEVDAGIGGKVAEVVGKKIRTLSDRHQILCITHLPQIASCGKNHYLVSKKLKEGRTLTGLYNLTVNERIEEIARMLTGVEMTDEAMANARRMVEQVT